MEGQTCFEMLIKRAPRGNGSRRERNLPPSNTIRISSSMVAGCVALRHCPAELPVRNRVMTYSERCSETRMTVMSGRSVAIGSLPVPCLGQDRPLRDRFEQIADAHPLYFMVVRYEDPYQLCLTWIL